MTKVQETHITINLFYNAGLEVMMAVTRKQAVDYQIPAIGFGIKNN